MTTSRTPRRGKTGLVEYWNETSRPLVSLAFVAPMLMAYEGGLLFLGSSTVMRNGADDWLRRFLQLIGFGQYLLLPLLTCGILLAWHHLTHDKWRVRWSVMTGMYLESALYAFVLLVLARIQGTIAETIVMQTPSLSEVIEQTGSQAGQFIAFLGAGIYEELLFRLMLLPVIACLLRGLHVPPKGSWVLAVVMSSLLFSAAHFQVFTGSGEAFSVFRFVFRFVAGVYFATVFLTRGFGIVAGSHALYDVIATMADA